MPKGIYQRTPEHKQRLREQISELTQRSIADGTIGRYTRTEAHRLAFAERVKNIARKEEKSPRWKGDSVGYTGVHLWMCRNYGKPSKCETCATESAKIFDWANISGNYLRKREDWKRLCRSCHMKEDGRGIAAVKLMHAAMAKKLEAENARMEK